MTRSGSRPVIALAALFVAVLCAASVAAAPEGQLTWGVHITLAPTWFDPAETPSLITPFMMMYALHDGIAKAMPDNPISPSLAESWKASPDGRVYDFMLRKGVKFHNGDPMTAEDVEYVYGSYPDIDSLFKDQAAELDRKKREALLHKIQQLVHEKVMVLPIWELGFLNGH
ncbi:MAG TPA: ABC transporter substrate-binding protein, partial [Methylomirabilota bacterium]|nr:ABC transporter substrate-binding protein [Methylomirabilota bacterium]